MNWLLKIVEGPVKGAEIALVEGLRLKVGSSETCDIVLADTTIPAEAFELDVSAAAVTLVEADGSASELVPFEVKAVGTTAFAVGPAEGEWKTLVRPAEKPAKPSEDRPDERPAEKEPAPAPEEPAKPTAEEPARTERKKRRHGVGCLVWLLLLILLGVLIWWFWPRIVEKVPKAEDYRVTVFEKAKVGWAKTIEATRKGYAWTKAKFDEQPEAAPQKKVVLPSLAEIASAHALEVVEADGARTLRGNCRRRTERLAIRALAQASDPSVKFDLTDDETLRDSANELLFASTEGSLKAVAATNRVVTLCGYAETVSDLERAIRALNADVKGIERLDTRRVRLGVKPPEAPLVPTAAEFVVGKAAPEIPRQPEKKEAKVQKRYLVAGILMKPYPCVVMRNGHRLVEGSELGTARIERIEADRIMLRDGGATFEWKP